METLKKITKLNKTFFSETSNTGASFSTLQQETLQVPTSDFISKDRTVLKFSSFNYKKARRDSNKNFLSIVSLHRAINLKPKEKLQGNWQVRLQSFSLTLRLDVIKCCDKAVNKVLEETKKMKTELKA